MSKDKEKKKTKERDVSKASAKAGAVAKAAPARGSTLASLREEIDRLFNEFAQGFPRLDDVWSIDLPKLAGASFTPATDLVENDGDYRLTVELPGMEEKNVEVEVDGGMLTIKGEKEEKKKESGDERHISERRYGYFRRSLRLPDDVDADKISAKLDKGVLRVVLPKGAKARKGSRRIEVA